MIRLPPTASVLAKPKVLTNDNEAGTIKTMKPESALEAR